MQVPGAVLVAAHVPVVGHGCVAAGRETLDAAVCMPRCCPCTTVCLQSFVSVVPRCRESEPSLRWRACAACPMCEKEIESTAIEKVRDPSLWLRRSDEAEEKKVDSDVKVA